MAERYEVRKLLGKGGMGVVYECYDRTLEEPVALKVLRADLAANPDLARRFRSEIKLARRVRHRNVCGIHEYGEAGPVSFIVMELVEGKDLRHLLRERGALPPQAAFDIAAQVADGLDAIHRAGIIHRDLKAPNLMRSPDGTVRLMDFGIAKQFGAHGTSATATGQVLGTPEYMSPEQGRGEKIDHRTDLYSLGVVIFELFTGRVPFQGDTPLATIFKHIQEPPPLEGGERPLPPSLVPILRRALAKDPDDRQSSAADLAAELRAAAGQIGASTSSPEQVRSNDSRTRTIEALQIDSRAVLAAPVAPVAPGGTPDRAGSGFPNAPSQRATRIVVGLGLGLALTVTVGVVLTIRAWNDRAAGSAREATVGAPERPPDAQPTGSPPTQIDTPSTTPAAASPTPSETPIADPVRATAVPKPTPRSTPAPAFGMLEVLVKPWAEVIVDGESLGTTPLRPLRLSIGAHEVELRHPKYKPLRKRVVVEADGVAKLKVDLPFEAFPK